MKIAAAALVWVLPLPLFSYVQARVWSDETRVWTQATQWAPEKVRPWVQLGEIAAKQGNQALAARHFAHAIAVYESGRPRFERVGCEIAVKNLVTVLDRQGQFELADQWSGHRCAG